MENHKPLSCVLLFMGIVLIGWAFVEIMEGAIWMVDKMDYILWSIIYLSGVIGVCTFIICDKIKK